MEGPPRLKKTRPSRKTIAQFARSAAARRSIGENRQCDCGESRPEALVRGSNPLVCYECFQSKRGLTTFENHHPAGKANNPATIPVPANDHRADLSVFQYDWPQKTLRNPDKSPLLSFAANVRGHIETVDYLNRALLASLPEMFEAMDKFLEKKLGRNWWRGTPFENLFSKRGVK
jgi:hypothetical protein